jgi:DNA gyrase subunit B
MTLDAEHLTHIRQHPDRYCPGGPLHLALEVMAYANDEAREMGRVGTCKITLRSDGSVIVSDDGRGTDTRRTARGQIVRKPVMATRDLRFFNHPDPELLPDGFPRHGISVVAALSEWLVHTNRRPEGAWSQRYEHGIPSGPLREVHSDAGQGTTVHYLYPAGPLSSQDEALLRDPSHFPWLVVLLHGPS